MISRSQGRAPAVRGQLRLCQAWAPTSYRCLRARRRKWRDAPFIFPALFVTQRRTHVRTHNRRSSRKLVHDEPERRTRTQPRHDVAAPELCRAGRGSATDRATPSVGARTAMAEVAEPPTCPRMAQARAASNPPV